ncbi:MAG: AEC family transporter [Gammaproteobacteria bacterium]
MNSVFQTLLPVFLLIAVGYLLRRVQLPGDGFWPPAERLTYFIFFPSLLVHNLSRAPLEGQVIGDLALTLAIAVTLMSLLALATRPFLHLSGPAFTSLFQCTIRFNTYIGIAAATALWGEAGLTLAAISLAILIPLINVYCVAVLIHWGDHGKGAGLVGVVLAILRNPLVLACATGIALNLSNWELPQFATGVLEILGRAALPLGLLAVGAGLNLKALRHSGKTVALSCFAKLLLMPLVMLTIARLLDLPALAESVTVLFAALPGATSAYILARQLGGDHELVAGMVTLQTGLAVVTLPLILGYLGAA